MKVFLDSSFLVAYVIDSDKQHDKALKLEKEGIFENKCYISNLIVNEIVTVIGNKIDLDLAIYSYYAFKDNFKTINEYEISNFNDNVIDIYKENNTKLSFTDCSILETMKEHSIDNLVSFDKEFEKIKSINIINNKRD
jgi:predicted nucleic acid-binding protein